MTSIGMAATTSDCGARPVSVGVSDERADRLATMFKALGDPIRLRMVLMIASRSELCVREITPAFELSSATISHHLRILREAGLVDCERRGTFVFYCIHPGAVDAITALVSQGD